MRWSRALLILGACAGLCPALPGPASAAATPLRTWSWPVDGRPDVLRAFAAPQTRYGPGHRGVDLAAGSGPVRSAGAGRVSYAGQLAGRGVIVVVHGALRTTYEPVAASVHLGDLVEAGTPIGRVAGQHAGCAVRCLHWGLLRGEVYLNPLTLLHQGPSRLLPVSARMSRGRAGLAVDPQRSGAVAPALVAPSPVIPKREVAWSLRAARSPGVTGAVLGLLLGLALMLGAAIRPRAPEPEPAAPAVGPTTGGQSRAATWPLELGGQVVDLDLQRARRRA